MGFFESLLLDPSAITFTALFIGLFVYVMKKNEEREKRYEENESKMLILLQECHDKKVPSNRRKK